MRALFHNYFVPESDREGPGVGDADDVLPEGGTRVLQLVSGQRSARDWPAAFHAAQRHRAKARPWRASGRGKPRRSVAKLHVHGLIHSLD